MTVPDVRDDGANKQESYITPQSLTITDRITLPYDLLNSCCGKGKENNDTGQPLISMHVKTCHRWRLLRRSASVQNSASEKMGPGKVYGPSYEMYV